MKRFKAQIMDCKRCSTSIYDWIAEYSPQGARGKPNIIKENYLKSSTENETDKEKLQNGFDLKSNNNGNPTIGNAFHIVRLMDRLEKREEHIRQIELELAQTKLALVEAQCKNQDLTHQVKLKCFCNALRLHNFKSN